MKFKLSEKEENIRACSKRVFNDLISSGFRIDSEDWFIKEELRQEKESKVIEMINSDELARMYCHVRFFLIDMNSLLNWQYQIFEAKNLGAPIPPLESNPWFTDTLVDESAFGAILLNSEMPTVFDPRQKLDDWLFGIPIVMGLKIGLLNMMYNEYSASKAIIQSRPAIGVPSGDQLEYKSRRDLNTFNRLTESNPEEISWAADRFKQYSMFSNAACQKSILFCWQEIKSERHSEADALLILKTMTYLWHHNTLAIYRKDFDRKFSSALSQRRHRANQIVEKRVPLNLHISYQSRNQLKELVKIKGQSQREILETLIYKAYKNKSDP